MDGCVCCMQKTGAMLDMEATEVVMDTDKINYATFYHFCLGYEVPQIDLKPPKICVRCSVKLEDAYCFIKKSMKIYEILISQQQPDTKAGIELIPEAEKTSFDDPKNDQGGDWWPKQVKKEPEWLNTGNDVIAISDDEEPTMEVDVIEQKYQPPVPENLPSSSQQNQESWFAISQPREIREDARTTRSQTKVVPEPEPDMQLAIDPVIIDSSGDASGHIELSENEPGQEMDVSEPVESEVAENVHPDDGDEEDDESEKEPEIYEFKCKLCPETFKAAKVLATHVKLHRDKTGAECLGCNIKFPIYYDVTVHMREKHRKKTKPQLRCLQCEVPPFVNVLALKFHLLRKHFHRTSGFKYTDTFLCKDCGLKFLTNNALYAHRKKTHTMLRVFQCSECPESFVRDYHRDRHFQAMHSAEKNFRCAHCDEAYRTKPELERHVKDHFTPVVEGGGVLKRKRRTPNEEPVKHDCKYCGKEFKFKSYLDIHEKRHSQPGFVPRGPRVRLSPSERVRCTKCPLVFSSQEAISVHMKFHSEQTKSECIECNIPFMSYNDLNIHLKFGHKPDSACPAPVLRCSQCVKPTFKNAVALKLHLLKRHLKKCPHSTDGSTCHECEMANSSCLRCKLCAATFRNKQSLNVHLKRHLTSKILRFRCSLCSKPCGNDAILKVHMQFHSENTRSGCSHCGLKFPSYFDLSAHLKSRHDNEPQIDLECSQCEGSAFKNAFGLRCHLHKMHLSSSALVRDLLEHKCTQCNKLFKNRGALNHHVTFVHSTDKKFECTLCNAKFKSNHSLKIHANAHQGEQNFKCSRCPATFRLSLQLTRHIKMHYLQKRAERQARPKGPKLRYRCKVPGCFKSYNFKSSLSSHAASHKTERDYLCPQCPSTFKTKAHLDRHVKRHTMKSQFLKCDQCTVYCMNEQSLRSHVLLHGDNTGGDCIDCDEKFTTYNDLSAHCKAQHKSVAGAPAAHPTVKCGQCDMPPFQNIFTLKCHILKQHLQETIAAATTNQDTQCEICKKQFLYRSELKVHMITHTRERNFKCKLCAAAFKSNFALGVHLKRHLEAKSLKNRCAVCSLYCGSEAALATHSKLHSERTGSECLECPEKFPCYNDLMGHIKTSHGPESANPMPMLKCNRCPMPHFKNLFALKLHFLKKHTRTCPHSTDDLCAACEALERNFQCKLCLASFKSKFALDLHLKRHLSATNMLKYRCSQCAKRCGNEASLKAHMVYHGEITSGDCMTCETQFASFNDLSIHMKQTHPEDAATTPPSLKCHACGAVFKNMHGFKLHLMRIHLEATAISDLPEQRCREPGCDKLFTSAQGLRIHVAAVHGNIRNFECTLCPMKFKQSGHLRVHLTTHSDARDFKCEQCPAAFKLQSALNKHLRLHLKPDYVPRPGGSGSRSGLLPMLVPRRPRGGRMRDENQNLECSTCGKEFQYPFQLKSHVLIHSDQRDFVCPMCSMAFKTNKHLAVHLKKHQKKSFMKYKCAVCSSICKNQFTLRKHMRLHSDQSSSECLDCAEKFTNYFQLVDHMKEKHDTNVDAAVTPLPSVKCGTCEADKGVYRTIETLRKHILAEH